MNAFSNSILGLVFLALSATGTFLMFKLWGYPYDHEKLKSSAPPKLMLLHHFIGYAYALIYVVLMIQMVPRLWTYEIEFPARTVVHLVLGMVIGILLFVKIAIVKWFKHMESQLVPLLGTALFVCTFLLIGLSVPFALKEQYLHRSAIGGSAFSAENIQRVRSLLPKAGFSGEVSLDELSSLQSLREGRDVLLSKCVQCHDLRTILIKPRSPGNWVQTVQRMAERSMFTEITEADQAHVATYLIAISPELQKGFSEKRRQESKTQQSKDVVHAGFVPPEGMTFDLLAAKEMFEATCAQCHGLKNIEQSPPASHEEVAALMSRMIDNGLEATEEELQMVAFHISTTYIKQ